MCLATGHEKTLIYHTAVLVARKVKILPSYSLVVVVSPLNALIADQRESCQRLKLKAVEMEREKTKCMLIGSNKKLQRKIALTVSIFDHCINNVTCFKYLGILISSDFSWTNHVEYMAGKVNQRLGLLRRIKHLLPFKARILFYKSLVMPLFEY